MNRSQALVEVALPLPIHHTFTYTVPGEAPEPGTRVVVPFRREARIGWVVGTPTESGGHKLRPVLSVLEDTPSVPREVLDLARWMADYYVAPLGIALRTALPNVLADVSRDMVELTGLYPRDVSDRQRKVLDWLAERETPQNVRTMRRSLGMGSVWPEIRSLLAEGALAHRTIPPAAPAVKKRRIVRVSRAVGTLAERESLFGRARRQADAYAFLEAAGGAAELGRLVGDEGFSRSVVSGLEEKGLVSVADEEELRDPFAGETKPEAPDLRPTPDQAAAIGALVAALEEETPEPFLLQGITGSGKTLVYIELLRAARALGRGGIVLVPEIALTPQTVTRFRAHFGDEVAVLHSGLSDGERYDAWRMLRSGERRIAVGARSALFAPVSDLGVVIVDEEHDGSYKQSEAPRYHARDLAVIRARAHGAVCVLGSATPSLESWRNASTGKFRRLELPERVGGGRLPEVRVVDLREGRASTKKPGRGGGVLSPPLVEAVDVRLRLEQQVILLLNRRGYSSFVQCRECGDVEQCPNCSISLTYHRTTNRLACHHCRHEIPAPNRCPRCGSKDLSYRGLGTEQVERVTAETFPDARIARMDVDTTSGKWAHQRILERVERHEVDILLGTQMIAKGLDFPRVTLVGVVNADVGIHLPDFRASERTFQLLSQVAGRAGRSSLAGEVLIQTSLPEHYAIQAAVRHDFEGFAEREAQERAGPGYPPHVRMVNAVFSSPNQRLAATGAEGAAAFVRQFIARRHREKSPAPDMIGPAPSPIEKLHGRWRWHLMLRASSPAALGAAARALSTEWKRPAGDFRLALDRDPVAVL